MKMISWNMQQKRSSWRYLLDLDIDLALLQETCKPPPDVAERIEAASAIEVDPVSWPPTAGDWPKYRTAIVKLSNRIGVEWIEATSIDMVMAGELGVSVPGLLSAVRVSPPSGAPVIVVSMYAHWVTSHARAENKFIFSDGSAHRVVSDLSAFVAAPDGHRILDAGDMNILRGYGEYGDRYWAARFQTSVRPNGSHRDALHRAGIPERSASGSLTGRIASGQQERSHLPFRQANGRDGKPSAGLRLRLEGTR